MRRGLVLVLAASVVPAMAPAQSTAVPAPRTRFSVQGVAGGAGGPHLELERAVGQHLALTIGTSAELRNPFGTNARRMSSLDLGLRRYLGPVQLRGLWLGGRIGYERQAPFAKDGPGVPSSNYLEAGIGYEKVLLQGITLGTSLGVQPRVGRQLRDTDRERYTAILRPRIGVGWAF